MTRDQLDIWLTEYGAAWETRDEQRVVSLFTEDGVYCWSPSGTKSSEWSEIGASRAGGRR
jgi:hypothetical protein